MQTKQWNTIDKRTWPRGPWDHEPDKLQWQDEATGLVCLIDRKEHLGIFCGYVGVPSGHPLHGKDVDQLPDLDTHGGINFAGSCHEGPPESGVCHVAEPEYPGCNCEVLDADLRARRGVYRRNRGRRGIDIPGIDHEPADELRPNIDIAKAFTASEQHEQSVDHLALQEMADRHWPGSVQAQESESPDCVWLEGSRCKGSRNTQETIAVSDHQEETGGSRDIRSITDSTMPEARRQRDAEADAVTCADAEIERYGEQETCSRCGSIPDPDLIYWLGFDCAHYLDFSPGLMAKLSVVLNEANRDPLLRGTYRTMGYVRAEVARLAAQLAAVDGVHP